MPISKNPIINLFRLTWQYSKEKKHIIVLIIIFFTLATSITLLNPYFISRIFNSIQQFEQGSSLMKIVFFNLSFLIFIQIGFWIFHGIGRVLERKNSFYVEKNFKLEAFNQVLELSPGWHRDHHSGDTIDKINKASNALGNFSSLLFAPLEAFIRFFGAVLILFLIDIPSSIIALLISLLSIYFIFRFDKKLSEQYKKLYLYDNSIAAKIHDFISNIITIITLRLKKQSSRTVNKFMMKPFSLFSRNVVLNEVKWFFADMMVTLMIVFALGLYSYNSVKSTGTVLIGTLFMLYSYLSRIGDTFFDFAFRYSDIIEQNTAVLSLEPVREAYNKVPFVEKSPELPKNWKKIEIKSLYFSYSDKHHHKYHMENIDIILKKGQKVAFIGESGSGKSTLLSLLRGLYATPLVHVFVDEKRTPYGLKHLGNNITLIPQSPEIFNSTIKNNITMGINYDEKEINKAIELSAFKSVVKRLRKGLETSIAEKGVNLSGGEKQRLALARGLLAAENSDILLLDEPTSSVDTKNELEIYKNIFKNYPKKTIASTIHRLHLLKYFDYIYYFDKGKVIAEGTLNDMMKNKLFSKHWKEYHKKH